MIENSQELDIALLCRAILFETDLSSITLRSARYGLTTRLPSRFSRRSALYSNNPLGVVPWRNGSMKACSSLA